MILFFNAILMLGLIAKNNIINSFIFFSWIIIYKRLCLTIIYFIYAMYIIYMLTKTHVWFMSLT